MSQQINLFNPALSLRQKQHTALLWGVGMVVAGVLLAGWVVHTFQQVRELETQLAASTRQLAEDQASLVRQSTQLAPQPSPQSLEEELRKLEAQLAAHQNMVESLKKGAIGNSSGFSEYMRAFARQSGNGVWLTGFNITGRAAQMRISGATLDHASISTYLHRLNLEPVLRGQPFAALHIEQTKPAATQNTKQVPAQKLPLEFTLQSVEVPSSTGAGKP